MKNYKSKQLRVSPMQTSFTRESSGHKKEPVPLISIYGLSIDKKRKHCQSAQGNQLISVPKQPVLMSPSSRREMDFNEQFSPVKSENIIDDEEENIS